MTVPFAVRDTRPLRPYVRAEVLNMMAISPEGRTVAELQTFLITQRPASRDTIARVLSSLVDQGLLAVCNEPAWRRRLRASLLAASLPRKAKGRRVDLRGRQHLLYTPTEQLHVELTRTRTLAPLTTALTAASLLEES